MVVQILRNAPAAPNLIAFLQCTTTRTMLKVLVTCGRSGSGNLSQEEFESFMRVASGEPEDPAAPPDGASANLESVTEGSSILAFFAAEQLW